MEPLAVLENTTGQPAPSRLLSTFFFAYVQLLRHTLDLPRGVLRDHLSETIAQGNALSLSPGGTCTV